MIKAGVRRKLLRLTINAVCGSASGSRDAGAQAVAWGDSENRGGGWPGKHEPPHVLPTARRDGQRMGDWKMVDTMIVDGLWDVYNHTTWASRPRTSPQQEGITRDIGDGPLASSQKPLPQAAIDAGQVQGRNHARSASPAQGRPGCSPPTSTSTRQTSAESWPACAPFDKAGSVTAGNASGINDGAAAVVVMSAKAAGAGPQTPGAHCRLWHQRPGPRHHGHGPPCLFHRKALQRAGWNAADVDLFELNERLRRASLRSEQRVGH